VGLWSIKVGLWSIKVGLWSIKVGVVNKSGCGHHNRSVH
jgi:hypothetical protein